MQTIKNVDFIESSCERKILTRKMQLKSLEHSSTKEEVDVSLTSFFPIKYPLIILDIDVKGITIVSSLKDG